ncbi:MAG: hypothetical protein JHD02_07515 [Thermoleophilaceae bacterium]|nr:hypothetical protein [Thermoleophilaceae bacterium]
MVLRSREQSTFIAIAGVCISAYWIIFAVRGFVTHDSVVEAMFGVAVGAIFATVFVRAGRARAVINGHELIVVNTFRTIRVDATEIREFRLGPKKSTLFYAAAAADLRDGSELIIFGIQSPNTAVRPNNTGAQELVERLNAWLVEACATSAVVET